MVRFDARAPLRAAGAVALVGALALGSAARAQALSDQLQVVSAGTTFTYTANDPTSGFESILAFANATGGMDYSSTLSPTFVTGSGASATFNTSGATGWFTHQKTSTTFVETGLTDPGTTTVSDVMLTFTATVNSTTVNVVALISDPTLVQDILAINAPSATVAETGALQNVTSLVFPSSQYSSAPFTVSVLSTVPEASTWMMLVCGMAAVGLIARRRTR